MAELSEVWWQRAAEYGPSDTWDAYGQSLCAVAFRDIEQLEQENARLKGQRDEAWANLREILDQNASIHDRAEAAEAQRDEALAVLKAFAGLYDEEGYLDDRKLPAWRESVQGILASDSAQRALSNE